MNRSGKPLSAGLYLVATPIGAARDITLRGLDILREADVIAAEDTRTARKLMDIHGIALDGRKVIAFHDHSGEAAVAGLLALIKSGQSLAYVAEAGTPLVADPGFELVRAARDAQVPVTAAPGASALLASLTIAGLPTDRFAFIGFLPSAKVARQREIADLREMPMTLVFYESPKRIAALLADLRDGFGGARPVALCRELTKKFEEVRRGTLNEVYESVLSEAPRGEIVLLVGRAETAAHTPEDIDAALRDALGANRVKDAVNIVAGLYGLPRKDVYRRALELKG